MQAPSDPEELDVNAILGHMQQTIANQSLELAKAHAMIVSRDTTIQALSFVVKTYEDKYLTEKEDSNADRKR